MSTLKKKKTTQCKSCGSSLFSASPRTTAQETASQPEELSRRGGQYICDFGEVSTGNRAHISGTDSLVNSFSAFSKCGKMQEFRFIKFSPENIQLSEGLFCQFSQSTESLIPDLHPELLSGCVEGQGL